MKYLDSECRTNDAVREAQPKLARRVIGNDGNILSGVCLTGTSRERIYKSGMRRRLYPMHWQFMIKNGLALCVNLNYD